MVYIWLNYVFLFVNIDYDNQHHTNVEYQLVHILFYI